MKTVVIVSALLAICLVAAGLRHPVVESVAPCCLLLSSIPVFYRRIREMPNSPEPLRFPGVRGPRSPIPINEVDGMHHRLSPPLSGPLAGPVLLVGAHPDDIELGAAGTALRLADEGQKVYGLVVTQGELGSSAPIGTRQGEAEAAAALLGFENLWMYDLPDTLLRRHIPEIRDVIEAKVRELGVRAVVTHGPQEVHGDHAAVFEAAKEASRNCSLVCFESISAPKEFVPNFFVNITPYISDKISAVEVHKTQAEKFYMNPELLRGRAAHRGLQAGVQYAEAFWIYRWVQ